MSIKTLLGFDYGTKRIGVAVGQTITQTANPLEQIDVHSVDATWQSIDKIVKQWRPHAFVVGKPINMDDSVSEIALQAEQFARELTQRYQVEVYMMDERLSSREARQRLASKKPNKKQTKAEMNSVAAQIILQDYLDLLQ